MGIFSRRSNPNLFIGIFMLLVLAMIASPNVLPRLASGLFPDFVYSGVPCGWLRPSRDRGNHQSLLGRNVLAPFELSISSSPIPAEANGFLTIRITVRNNSLGTVPFVYNPTQVSIGDNGTTGLGILFTPNNSLTGAFPRPPDPTSFAESDIRLLGPRQSCVHTVEIPGGNVLVDPALTSGTAQVRAYYRGATRGTVIPTQPPAGIPVTTPIYPDQGIWVGFVESPAVPVLLPGVAAAAQ